MNKDFSYYLSLGLEPKIAEYYASGRRQIINVVPNEDFTLTLTFDNGEVRLYDVKPCLLPNTVFAPFRNQENFRRVYLDENHCICWDIDPNIDSNIVWDNKVDLCPDGSYIDSIPLNNTELHVPAPSEALCKSETIVGTSTEPTSYRDDKIEK